MFLAVGVGVVLGLAWRRRAWWLGWALLWLLMAPPEPTPWPLLLVATVGAVVTWPPVRWALSMVRGRGGMGGVHADNGLRTTLLEGQMGTGTGTGGAELLSFGGEPRPRRWAVSALVPFGPWPRWTLGIHWPPLRRVEQGYVTGVMGSGGTGKSYLLLTLAVALLTGGEWLGRRGLRLRSVLYVDCELDTDTQKERAYQVARGMGLRRPPGPSRWWQLPWVWVRPWGLHYYRLPCSVASAEGLALVARQVRRTRAELVLFDSLTIGAAGAALSDQNAWNAVLTGMERWGVPVVLIDHTPKSGGTMVGSFMKQAKVRSAVALERAPDGGITVTHEKANFGPTLPALRIRPVFEHGDPDDPEPATVRFDVLGGAAPAQHPTAVGLSTPAATAAPAWGERERRVLDAWQGRGAAGATAREIAAQLEPELGKRAYKAVCDSVKRLEPAGALLLRELVPTPGGGPPSKRYVAVGALPVAGVAVAQAEALLRQSRPRGARGARR